MPLSAASVPEPSASDAPTTAQQREILQEYSTVASAGLLPHQLQVHDAIVNNHTGIAVLSGAGGAGKTHVLKNVTHTLRNQSKKSVMITATTARAALNLSRFGRTLHSAFGLAVGSSNALTFWQPFHPNMMLLRTTDVFIIDEMSMLTQQHLFFVLYRIMSACGYANVEEVLAKKLIILSGDLFQVSLQLHALLDPHTNFVAHSRFFFEYLQLPPVCKCKKHGICPTCHITSSQFWPLAKKYDLEGSVRHCEDTAFGQFCHTIRKYTPTPEQIDAGLHASPRISKASIAARAAPTQNAGADAHDVSTVLCTHNRDVQKHNADILHRLCGEQVVSVPLDFRREKIKMPPIHAPELIQHWLEKPGFHTLSTVAVGAPVMLTANFLGKASNSDVGTVVNLEFDDNDPNMLLKVFVQLHHNNAIVQVSRTVKQTQRHNFLEYSKATFPLQLAYAMTAHKAQGATIVKPVIVDAEGAFEHGQLYVLFSRVTKSSLITIAGKLTPEHFQPIQIPGLNTN